MKKVCLLLVTCCCLVEIYAQQQAGLATACLTPFGCSNDLRNAFYTDIQIDTLTESYAKIPIPANYHDVMYGSKGDCKADTGMTICKDDSLVLKYKVFYPAASLVDYNSCKLPAVFIIHGGGFQDCGGSYLDSGIVKICQEFAKLGVIAVSIEYRLGALAPSITQYSAQQELAIYRAAQDIRGFIRTFIKRQWSTEPTREPYQVDTAKLFIGGASAGSVVAMSAIFYTQDMLNQVYPGVNNSNILGAVDKNFYYGEPTINYSIKGFMDMWGGLAIPPNPTYLDSPELFFNQNPIPKPPTIIFHGKEDKVFIYNHKNVNFYQSGMFNSESNCLQSNPATYTLNSDPNIDGYLLGGQEIYNMFKRLKIGTEYYLDCEMMHGLDNCTDTCYKSNYGVSTNIDATTTAIYMVQRAATFFQAIINNKLSLLTTTSFIECGNSRFRCFVADNNAGCQNSDTPAKCLKP